MHVEMGERRKERWAPKSCSPDGRRFSAFATFIRLPFSLAFPPNSTLHTSRHQGVMFKRVQKRQRKQEKEEELGLDSELKEVLGLQDTDSEESDSGSDDSSDESGSEDEGDAIASGEEDQEELEEMESDAEDSAEEDEIPPMSVMEAVSDPLYVVSLDPDVRACILCPGKLLKNTRMSDIHKASKVSAMRHILCLVWFKQLIALRHITDASQNSSSSSKKLALRAMCATLSVC